MFYLTWLDLFVLVLWAEWAELPSHSIHIMYELYSTNCCNTVLYSNLIIKTGLSLILLLAELTRYIKDWSTVVNVSESRKNKKKLIMSNSCYSKPQSCTFNANVTSQLRPSALSLLIVVMRNQNCDEYTYSDKELSLAIGITSVSEKCARMSISLSRGMSLCCHRGVKSCLQPFGTNYTRWIPVTVTVTMAPTRQLCNLLVAASAGRLLHRVHKKVSRKFFYCNFNCNLLTRNITR